jgi:L-lactate dehydrogenase (cytochrome)
LTPLRVSNYMRILDAIYLHALRDPDASAGPPAQCGDVARLSGVCRQQTEASVSFSNPTITNVEDLRALAKRRVPKMFYDYVDSGSWTESTYRANSLELAKIKLRQRVAVDISNRSLGTTLVGEQSVMPVALAPAGLTGLLHADGEILAARAAESFGVPFTLSTMSICSIEDVAACTTKPFWFQLYMMKDRSFMERLIGRAHAAKSAALVLTVDLPVQSQRHKDVKNGLSAPPKATVRNLLNFATKPGWCLGMAQTKRRSFGNIVGHIAGVSNMSSLAEWVNGQFDQSLSWEDVRWVRKAWDRKLVIKGVMDPEDARAAVTAGADAIVVSNHGGRQLDGALSTIEALPHIVKAVGGQVETLFDSGVRSGQDVFRALALGAKGVFIGRAFLYGLGAMGEAGVLRCLDVIRRELDFTMALCGVNDVRLVNRSAVHADEAFPPQSRRDRVEELA